MAVTVRASVSAEQTRARLARQLDTTRARRQAARNAWAAVEQIALPDAVLVEERPDDHGRAPLQIWGMGTATVYCRSGFDDERRYCLTSSWRHDRYAERTDVPRGRGGYAETPESFDGPIADLERRLDQILRRLPPRSTEATR
jgi:hypothetical protein